MNDKGAPQNVDKHEQEAKVEWNVITATSLVGGGGGRLQRAVAMLLVQHCRLETRERCRRQRRRCRRPRQWLEAWARIGRRRAGGDRVQMSHVGGRFIVVVNVIHRRKVNVAQLCLGGRRRCAQLGCSSGAVELEGGRVVAEQVGHGRGHQAAEVFVVVMMLVVRVHLKIVIINGISAIVVITNLVIHINRMHLIIIVGIANGRLLRMALWLLHLRLRHNARGQVPLVLLVHIVGERGLLVLMLLVGLLQQGGGRAAAQHTGRWQVVAAAHAAKLVQMF